MTDAESPWLALLHDPPAGAHVILWCDETPACHVAMETFLDGGLQRDDLCVVVLPMGDLDMLRSRLLTREFDLDCLGDQGRVLVTTPENLGLREVGDADRIATIAADLRRLAQACGRSGVTVLGRVAPPFFESGRREAAEALERALRDYASDVRMLCPYRVDSVRPRQMGEAAAVIRCHTHAVTLIGGDQLFMEPVHTPAGV